MTSNPHSRALFVKADGGPMYFSMVPCSERKEIRQLIENGGGVLLRLDKNPDVVRLVPTSITTTEGPDDAFSTIYIRACVYSNKLFPLKEFILPRVSAAETDGDCKVRKLCSVRSRREYTLEEEIAMAKYIANKPSVRVRGNAVYKEMAAACAVPGGHPWQSLKQHYLKKILPFKHQYESPVASKLVKRHAREAQEARDAAPSATSERKIVNVEDGSSDDEQLPKPRGATDGGVEKKSVRLRGQYTLGEQIAMAKYIANKPNVRVRGNAIYKEMAAACAVPGNHPWQSLRQHYLKKILPWKRLYESLGACELVKRYAHEAQEARDASPCATSERGIVLVEDSSSDYEQFPKPRRAADGEVENWDTKTEVVEETECQGASCYLQDCDTPAVGKRSSRQRRMKHKKILLSAASFSGSCKKSSSEVPPRNKSNVPTCGKNSHDDGIVDSDEVDEVVPKKSAMPTPQRVHSKTSSIQTQSHPGKRNDRVGIADSQTAAVAETNSGKKHVLQSSRRKSKNAKQQETPADESTHVHSIPDSDLSGELCVPDIVGMQQTTQPSPQKKVGTATSQKHTSGHLSPSLLFQSHDCTAS
nr:uncharacterized protein LOC126521193 [Dermacentor andersoni]